MNFISEKPSWRERVALGRIAPSTLCVSAARLRCSSRDLTWVTLSQTPPRMFCLLSRAANVRARAYAHGHVCARARAQEVPIRFLKQS